MLNNKLRARVLRKNMTSQERKLWDIIRNRQFFGYRFLRQYCIGNYIVDFINREKNIILEIDGGQHNHPNDISYDKERTEYLNSQGYTVIRYWNNDIYNNVDGVYTKLKEVFCVKD